MLTSLLIHSNETKFEFPAHGGGKSIACEHANVGEDGILDFSASINPLGPPKSVLAELSNMGPQLACYPDSSSSALKKQLARTLNVVPAGMVVTNGSMELIFLLPNLLTMRDEVLLISPCFSEYQRAFELANIVTNNFVVSGENEFCVSSEKIISELEKNPQIKAVVLGHPNNPTGRLWDKIELQGLLEYCEGNKCFLIIDETFIEFCAPGDSFLGQLEANEFLILIRSLTKFYALPGLRLGYGVMHPKSAKIIEKFRPSWSVNGLAQHLGCTALLDKEYAIKSRNTNRMWKQKMFFDLSRMKQLKVFPSDANFILFQLSEDIAPERFYMEMIQNGILLRNCGNFVGLDSSCFRVAVREDADNQKLLAALDNSFAELPVG
jgi:threonine-phosphate decarboxylase